MMSILIIGILMNCIISTYLTIAVGENDLIGAGINRFTGHERYELILINFIPYCIIGLYIVTLLNESNTLKKDLKEIIFERSFILGLKRSFKISSHTGFYYCYLTNEFWQWDFVANNHTYAKIGVYENMVEHLQLIISNDPSLWVYHLDTFEWLTFTKIKYKL